MWWEEGPKSECWKKVWFLHCLICALSVWFMIPTARRSHDIIGNMLALIKPSTFQSLKHSLFLKIRVAIEVKHYVLKILNKKVFIIYK